MDTNKAIGDGFPINGFVGGCVVLNDGQVLPIESQVSANPATEGVTKGDENAAQVAAHRTLKERGLLGRSEGAQVAIQKKSVLPWHDYSIQTRPYGATLFGPMPVRAKPAPQGSVVTLEEITIKGDRPATSKKIPTVSVDQLPLISPISTDDLPLVPGGGRVPVS